MLIDKLTVVFGGRSLADVHAKSLAVLVPLTSSGHNSTTREGVGPAVEF